MLIKILPGEYMWSEQGFHIIGDAGFALVAEEECEVEVTDENQLAIILAYQQQKRNPEQRKKPEPQPEPVQEEQPVPEEVVQEEQLPEENNNG